MGSPHPSPRRCCRCLSWGCRASQSVQCVPYRLFGSPGPSTALLSLAHEVFRNAPFAACSHKRLILSQASIPFRDPFRRCPDSWRCGKPHHPARSSSHEVLRPSSGHHCANRQLPGSTRTPSPYDFSQVLEGLILAQLCGLVACRCRSWGFSAPQGFSPPHDSTALVRRRSPPGVPCFRRSRAPSGVSVMRRSVPAQRSIASVGRPMPSRASFRLRGLQTSRLGLAPLRYGKPPVTVLLIRSWPYVGSVLARTRR